MYKSTSPIPSSPPNEAVVVLTEPRERSGMGANTRRSGGTAAVPCILLHCVRDESLTPAGRGASKGWSAGTLAQREH